MKLAFFKNNIIFGLLLFSIQGFSQSQTWDMAPQPPEVAEFSKYGNYPVSYYTGTPQISIPIFTIKEKDIEIPITLSYGGNGVRVADESTWVGLGWNLFPGGQISRIVVGSQYDNHNSDVYNALLNAWVGEESNYFRRYDPWITTQFAYTEGDIEEVPANLGPGGTVSGPYVDLPSFTVSGFESWSNQAQYFQPDLYSFSFLGYSGKFFFNPETDEPVLLDKTAAIKFEKVNPTSWDPEEDGWKVTLPNGVVIFFEDIDIVKQKYVSCTSGAPSITWKISKIKLINDEEINFTYEDVYYETATITNIDVYSYEDDQDYELNQHKDYQLFNLPTQTVTCNYNRSPNTISNEIRLLKKITSPKHVIDFKKILGESKPRLDYIEIYELSNSSTKFGYKFSFEEFNKVDQSWITYGSNNSQLGGVDGASFIKWKLKKVEKYGVKNGVTKSEEPYQFFYTEDIGLPGILSYAQDYWGYYNGEHSNTGLIPDETQMYANEGYIPVSSLPDRRPTDDLRGRANANRGASVNHMIQGTLNKIIYPTKGYTKFNFEPHEFYLSDLDDYILMADEINYSSGYYYNIYNGSHTVMSKGAGVRIKEQINYDADGSFVGRTKFDYGGSGLLLTPVHFWRIERFLQAANSTDIFFYKTWNASGSNYSQSFATPNSVGYTSVLVTESDSETDHAGEKLNGSILYNFHNYETPYNPQLSSVSVNYLDARNGFPRLVNYRDNADNLIKSVEYFYKKIESSMFLSMSAKHINVHSDPLLDVFKVDYTPLKSEFWKESYIVETVDGVEQKTIFDYSTDGLGNMISKQSTSSDGDLLESKYKYPMDYNVSATGTTGDPEYNALREMVEKNMVNIPVEIINLKNDKVINGSFNTFKLFYGIPQVYQSFSIETETPLTINATSNQNDNNKFDWSYTNVPSSGFLIKDNFYSSTAKVTIKNYNDKGNLTEYSLSDIQSGSYLWGYRNKYPVFKIENASESVVLSKLSAGDLSNLGGTPTLSQIKAIHDKLVTIPGAMVYGYVYDPLIGMVAGFDPNGLKTEYEYDELGRLKYIKDYEGNIIQANEYNYKSVQP